MTPAEADRRIIPSQQTPSQYIRMTAAGIDPAPGTTALIHAEIAILEAVGDKHPGQTQKLVVLAPEWVAFRDKIWAKLH